MQVWPNVILDARQSLDQSLPVLQEFCSYFLTWSFLYFYVDEAEAADFVYNMVNMEADLMIPT